MWISTSYAAIVSLVAFQIMLYLGGEILRVRPQRVAGMEAGAVFYMLATAGVAALVGRLNRRPPKYTLWFVGGVAAFLVATRIPGVRAWEDNLGVFMLVSIGYVFAFPVACHLFFLYSPPAHRGLWFGLSLSIAMALRTLVFHLGAGMERARYSETVFSLGTVAIAVWGALCLFLCLRGSERERRDECPEPGAENGAAIKRMLLAYALFFVMHGFLSTRLFLFVEGGVTTHRTEAVQWGMIAVCTLVGQLIDRNIDSWFSRVMPLCGFAFLLSPLLFAIDASDGMRQFIHAMAALGQTALFVGTTVAVGALAPAGKWRLALICAPFCLRFLQILTACLSRLLPDIHKEIIMVASVLMAGLFYHLVSHLPRVSTGRRPSERKDAPVAESAVGNPVPGGLRELFVRDGLSAREIDVALLLARGMSTQEIAAALSISENTVKFHVKNILRKTGTANRKTFLARIASGTWPAFQESV